MNVTDIIMIGIGITTIVLLIRSVLRLGRHIVWFESSNTYGVRHYMRYFYFNENNHIASYLSPDIDSATKFKTKREAIIAYNLWQLLIDDRDKKQKRKNKIKVLPYRFK